MTPRKVFVDSDIVLSSLLTDCGATHILLNKTPGIECYISILSMLEVKLVAERLNIAQNKKEELEKYLLEAFSIADINKSEEEIKRVYQPYVKDLNQAHVVAGLASSKADFFLSNNLNDFNTERIKQDFSAILLKPAQMLQYLRSLK